MYCVLITMVSRLIVDETNKCNDIQILFYCATAVIFMVYDSSDFFSALRKQREGKEGRRRNSGF